MDLALLGLYYLFIFLNFCCITTQQDMVRDTGVPMVVKGTFYTMYIPYPQTQLAQLRKNGKTHTKNREIRDPYPTPGINSGFWFRRGWLNPGVLQNLDSSLGSTVTASLLEQFQQSKRL